MTAQRHWHDLAQTLLADIRELGFDGVGITRDSYGHGENAAVDYLTRFATAHGLHVTTDRAANVIFHAPDAAPGPALWCGSHLDSVPQGGNYDGMAGIVAGLLCLLRLRDARARTPHPFKVIALRGEESAWFGKPYLGSSALFGKLSPQDLALTHRASGRTLAQCLRHAGADLDAIRRGERLVGAHEVAGYIELHIEQGPLMVARALPTAIVPCLRGNVRHNRVRCLGDAGHSGAVPRWLRHDAVFAVAELIVRLDEHWRALLEKGVDLVVTVGMLSTCADSHAVSRIPGAAEFSFEARSGSQQTLDDFHALLLRECDAVAAARGVRFEFDRRINTPPAVLHRPWVDALVRISRDLGLPDEQIPSGAGHDAAMFANAGVPAAMIFVRNEHGSHNPYEAMDLDDFMRATEILYHAAQELQ